MHCIFSQSCSELICITLRYVLGGGRDEDSVEEEDSEEDGEDGPGLSALYDNTADLDDDDEADYEGNEAEGDDSDLEDEDEEDGEPTPDGKGVKRKLEEDH